MIKATNEERKQIEEFFYLIRENFENILLYPLIDKKTNIRRLAICIADKEKDIIYVKGLYFLPYDPLCGRFELIDPDTNTVLLEKPPGLIKRFFEKIKAWRL